MLEEVFGEPTLEVLKEPSFFATKHIAPSGILIAMTPSFPDL